MIGLDDLKGLFQPKRICEGAKAVFRPASPLCNVDFSFISPNLADMAR